MQRVTMVRYSAKPDRIEENETLARAVFAELKAVAPNYITYALFRDGVDFVHLFVNGQADDSDVLTELPAFKAYAKNVLERCEKPPEVTRLSLNLLDSYGLSSFLAPA
jgi:quinol monooxygenase YgiN